jgi:hypothetical protein
MHCVIEIYIYFFLPVTMTCESKDSCVHIIDMRIPPIIQSFRLYVCLFIVSLFVGGDSW